MAYPQNYHHLNVSVHFYLGLIVAIMFHPLTKTRISPKREIFNTEPSKTQSCHFTHPKNFKHKMPRSLAPAPSPHFLAFGFCPAPSSGFCPAPSSRFHPTSPWNPLAIALVGAICTVFLFLSCHQIQRHCYTFHMITFSGNRAQRQRRRLNEHNPDELSQQFRSQGLDPYITRSLPIIQFKKKEEGESSQSSTECAVCLGEFEEGEGLKQLPNCSHFFHVSCIDTWLMTHSSCPLCRSQVFNHEYSVSVCSLEENPSREDLLRERSAMHQVLRSHILRSSILRG